MRGARRSTSGRSMPAPSGVGGGLYGTVCGSAQVVFTSVFYSQRGAPLKVSTIENGVEVFPFIKEGRRQPVRRAFDDRAQAALLEDALERSARRGLRSRHRLERAVLLELDAEFGLDSRRFDAAI